MKAAGIGPVAARKVILVLNIDLHFVLHQATHITHFQMPAPLTESTIFALSQLVDDAQSGTREPSHSDLSFEVDRAQLTAGDPYTQGQTVGKKSVFEERLIGRLKTARRMEKHSLFRCLLCFVVAVVFCRVLPISLVQSRFLMRSLLSDLKDSPSRLTVS